VISFINYKGGVGKTTSTYHIGCSLVGHHDKKVLLIVIDPQTNLTFLCGPVEEWNKHKRNIGTIATMYKRYQDRIALDTKR
jgi:chromosome partitioning protein